MGALHTDRYWRRNTERLGSTRDITLAGPLVLTERDVLDVETFNIDPGGAIRNIDLPATSTTLRGIKFIINATGGNFDLTVRLTAAGATVATISQNEMCEFLCWSATAGSWRGAVSKAT